MSKPTQEEIKAEIKKLKELELHVRPYSAFGGDNRAQVRAEIEVLERNLSEGNIWNMANVIDEDMLSIMLDARRWLDGEEEQAPSEGWKDLVAGDG